MNDQDGKMLENLGEFTRALRGAGLNVSLSDTVHACNVMELLPIGERQALKDGLRATMTRCPEEYDVFDQTFDIFFKNHDLFERLMAPLMPVSKTEDDKKPAPLQRVQQAFGRQNNTQTLQEEEWEFDRSSTASSLERLQHKDFEQMTSDEYRDAIKTIHRLIQKLPKLPTRRVQPARRGIPDMNRSLRASLRRPMAPAKLVTVAPRLAPQPLIILIDISGSMEQYARIFLHFMHALGQKHRRIHMFTFGTRLTKITGFLRTKDVDKAIFDTSNAVKDWSGGTNIGSTLQDFARQHAGSLSLAKSHLLLVTDGLERGDVTSLEGSMKFLSLRTKKMTWLNPLLRYEQFEPKARGIKAILPYVDEFKPVHNLSSLEELARSLYP